MKQLQAVARFSLKRSDLECNLFEIYPVGLIQRIQKKYEEDPVNYGTLQGLVEYEMTEGIHHGRRSCTTSLLWLKR